jgi:hypothetical protein
MMSHPLLAHNCTKNSQVFLFSLYYGSAQWIKFIILQIISLIFLTFNVLEKNELSGIIIVGRKF